MHTVANPVTESKPPDPAPVSDPTAEQMRAAYQAGLANHTLTIEHVLVAVDRLQGARTIDAIRRNVIHRRAQIAVASLSDSTVERAHRRADRVFIEDLKDAAKTLAQYDAPHEYGHLVKNALDKLVAFVELTGADGIVAAYEGALVEPSYRACWRCGSELETEQDKRTGRCTPCQANRDARIAMVARR